MLLTKMQLTPFWSPCPGESEKVTRSKPYEVVNRSADGLGTVMDLDWCCPATPLRA